MLIRYHLFYYALGALCLVLAKVFHPLFYIIYFFYCIFIYYRLSFAHLLILNILCFCLWIYPQHISELPLIIEGKVTKVGENYCYLKTKEGTIKVYHEISNVEYGDLLKLKVQSLELYNNTNDYAFCERNYLYGQKIFHKVYAEKLFSHQKQPTFYRWLEQRLSYNQTVQDYQRLFVLGERSTTIGEDYQILTELSLVHMFALSGMHIHILYALIKKSISLFIPRTVAKIISFGVIGFYIFSIPMLISLYRAFFVMLLYEMLKKWFHKLDIFSFIVILSLFYNPYIIYNISFVFSYFIYFIVLITRHLRYSSFWIYLSSLPIILTLNAQIPIVAFFVSDILNAFIEIFYSISILSIFFPVLEICLKYLVVVFQNVLSFLSNFNAFIVFSKPTMGWLVLFYFLFFKMLIHQELKRSYKKEVMALLSLLVVFQVWSRYKIYGEVTMIDVGQGDCTFIRLPMNQGNILIDTGGTKDYDIATQTLIPYFKSIGVTHLDYVYISHNDYDHCGALTSLLENFSVGEVIDSFQSSRSIGCAEIQMLKNDNIYTDSNDQSLIIYVSLPAMNILFTGDASSVVEQDMLEQFRTLDVDVLKVSHHGSATASSSAFLSAIHPDIAMIGVKKNNMYRHPSLQVIERLERKGITILRTDQDGMFHIRFYGKDRYIFR